MMETDAVIAKKKTANTLSKSKEVKKMIEMDVGEAIPCTRGRCWKMKRKGTWFEGLFVKGDIVHEINKDLWRKNIYG